MAKVLTGIDDLMPDAQLQRDCAVFRASFPPIQSAIKIYGGKQGMRVQLDIPESEMSAAMSLFLWRECVLKVTVEPCNTETKQEYGQKCNDLATRSKRKS